MADQPTTPSGSRWEPDPEGPTSEAPVTGAAGGEAPEPDAPVAAAPSYPFGTTQQAAGPAIEPVVDATAAERGAQLRGRAILAGAATALTLAGGVTGFVIGHTTAGDNAGFRPAGNVQRDGSGPQFGRGQQGPPSFPGGDRDGDQDGDGFGPPQGFDGGSSGGSRDPGDSGSSGSTDGTSSSGTGT